MHDSQTILVLNPYSASGYSGPRIFADRLFGGIAKAGVNLVAVGRGGDNSWATENVRVRGAGRLGPSGQVMWALQASFAVARRRRSVDVVHIHGCYLFGLVPALIASILRVPYVLLPLLAGGDLTTESRLGGVPGTNALRRRIIGEARAGFALGQDIASELTSWGLEAERVGAIGNVVDIDCFRPSVPDQRWQRFTLGFVGKLGGRKGALSVLAALARLRSRYPSATALFVGPFEDEAFARRFHEEVDALNLTGSVTVTGYRQSVRDFVCNEMSVFVLPSRAEGLPGALCEAMAAGLPVAVTGFGAMKLVVQESGAGGLVTFGDPDSIVQAVDVIWQDERVWLQKSRLAREYAESHFAIETNVVRYLKRTFGEGDVSL